MRVLRLVVGVLLVLAVAPPASGDDTRVSFGVQPANAAGGIDDRAVFAFDVSPQTVVYDFVGLLNYGAEPLRLSVYATDAGSDPETGAFSAMGGDDTATGVGRWVTIGEQGAGPVAVTVPPADQVGPGTVVLPLTIAVPADAEAGDHAGAVVAALTTDGDDAGGRQVRLDQRVASRVYLRIAGELAPGLEIDDVSTTHHGSWPWQSGAVDVRYTITNSGNARLGAQPFLLLSGAFGLGEKRVATEPIAEILPGASVERSETVTGVWSLTSVDTTIRLEALAAPGSRVLELAPVVVTSSARTTGWVVPAGALLVVVLVGGAMAARRRRRARGAHPT